MNFLLDDNLRAAIINQLDADGHEDLCVKLEQLPAIIPGTIYTKTSYNHNVPIVCQSSTTEQLRRKHD